MIAAQAPVFPGPAVLGNDHGEVFFNVHAEDGVIPDLVGIDLPHIEAVKEHAASHIVDLWEARVLAGKPPYVGWLGVVDEYQRAVFQIPL